MIRKISARTWNNILIFSVLALILILNVDVFKSQSPDSRLIVPEGEFIQSLDINQVKIERAGPQWRINPNGVQPETVPTAEHLATMVSAWQQAQLSKAELEFDANVFSSPETLVVINLAGKAEPTVVALEIVGQQLFFVVDAKVYVLESPSVMQLLEPIVNVKQ